MFIFFAHMSKQKVMLNGSLSDSGAGKQLTGSQAQDSSI